MDSLFLLIGVIVAIVIGVIGFCLLIAWLYETFGEEGLYLLVSLVGLFVVSGVLYVIVEGISRDFGFNWGEGLSLVISVFGGIFVLFIVLAVYGRRKMKKERKYEWVRRRALNIFEPSRAYSSFQSPQNLLTYPEKQKKNSGEE